MPDGFAAIILAGGTAARLGGADKSAVEVGGRTLLARALDAVAGAVTGAGEVVVVGDPVVTEHPVTFVREDPPFGGPVAGLLTGVDALAEDPSWVLVLACDMPFVTAGTVHRLRAAADGRAGAVLVGPDGRRQLAFVVAAEALSAARPSHQDQHGAPLQPLLRGLDLAEVPALGREHRDVDTWADVADLRDIADAEG